MRALVALSMTLRSTTSAVVVLSLIGIALIAIAPTAAAQSGRCRPSMQTEVDVGRHRYQGELCLSGIHRDGGHEITTLRARYRFGALVGEPTAQFSIAWETQEPGLQIERIRLRARVRGPGAPSPIFIEFSPDLIPDPGGGFGWAVAGSPDWDELFVDALGHYVSAENARAAFRAGFELDDLTIVELVLNRRAEDQQCPTGMLFDASQGRCQCPAGREWHRGSRSCVEGSCSGGSTWNARAQRCECPSAQAWSVRRRACVPDACTGGRVLDGVTEQCACPPSAPLFSEGRCAACEGELEWNGSACACPPETPVVSARGRCTGCPEGASWNGSACACGAGAPLWDASTNRCRPCPAGESFDARAQTCVGCNPACGAGQSCVAGVCVGTGAMRITLTWDRPGDMDLHVGTPAGEHIYYGHRGDGSGQLDHDDTRGTGPENIYWTAAPPSGVYHVCVIPYSVRGPTSFELIVVQGASVQRFSGVRQSERHGDGCDPSSPSYVTSIHAP